MGISHGCGYLDVKYRTSTFFLHVQQPSPSCECLDYKYNRGMFKIGEFSKLMHVSIRMLRYYDEMGLLKPAVVDRYTGYRLYSIDQIPALQQILLLRDLDFPIMEMPAILSHWDDDNIRRRLAEKRGELESELRRQQYRLQKLDQAIQDIEHGTLDLHYAVSLKTIPSLLVLSLRRIIPAYDCEETLWYELGDYMRRHGVCPAYASNENNLTIYHDPAHKDHDVDVEVASVIEKPCLPTEAGFSCRNVEAVENMACVMVYGPFSNIDGAYRAFARWLDDHNQYIMSGLSRQICHKGPWDEPDPAKYLTELQLPVERKNIT